MDVNVHPAKKEVRFRRSADVVNTIVEAIANTLQKHARQEIHASAAVPETDGGPPEPPSAAPHGETPSRADNSQAFPPAKPRTAPAPSLFGYVSIDSIAGPSEIMVLADETANPRFVAADLLSQAEHDEMASAILVTTSETLAEQVSV